MKAGFEERRGLFPTSLSSQWAHTAPRTCLVDAVNTRRLYSRGGLEVTWHPSLSVPCNHHFSRLLGHPLGVRLGPDTLSPAVLSLTVTSPCLFSPPSPCCLGLVRPYGWPSLLWELAQVLTNFRLSLQLGLNLVSQSPLKSQPL